MEEIERTARTDKTEEPRGARHKRMGGWVRLWRGKVRAGPGRRIAVLERSAGGWRILNAEAGGEELRVLGAQTMPAPPSEEALEARAGLGDVPKGAEVLLVLNSDRNVCRWLQLPAASAEHTRRMVSFRLETELPYPMEESAWVCERQTPEDKTQPGNVLVVAGPQAEIAGAQQALEKNGLRVAAVEFDVAALADLAAACARGAEGVAGVYVEDNKAMLTVMQGGELKYMRRIQMRPGLGGERRAAELASELDQSIHGYLLRGQKGQIQRVLLYGPGRADRGLKDALREQLGLEVEEAELPEFVRIIAAGAAEAELLGEYAGCLGAAAAAHRRLRGEKAVAPALRQRRGVLGEVRWRRTAALVGANAAVLCLVVGASFGVRMAKLHAATRVIKEAQPHLQDLEALEEEVGILQKENPERRSALDVLLALADVMPPGVSIVALNIDPRGQVTISGKTPSVEVISDTAMPALEGSQMFANPKLLDATKEEQGFTFQMTVELRKG